MTISSEMVPAGKTKLSIERTLTVSSFLTRNNFSRVCSQLVPMAVRGDFLKLISTFAWNTVWRYSLQSHSDGHSNTSLEWLHLHAVGCVNPGPPSSPLYASKRTQEVIGH